MSHWILGFQNGHNQAVPGLHVMQFWSENILVISNQGDAVFDFKVSQYDFTSSCTSISSIPFINQTFLCPIITVISTHTSNPAATTALNIVKWNGIRKCNHSVSEKKWIFHSFSTTNSRFFLYVMLCDVTQKTCLHGSPTCSLEERVRLHISYSLMLGGSEMWFFYQSLSVQSQTNFHHFHSSHTFIAQIRCSSKISRHFTTLEVLWSNKNKCIA